MSERSGDDVTTRRRFAVPPLPADVGADAEGLHPADPADRALLIRLAHPEIDAALRQGRDEIEVEGRPVNARLHLAMHEIVAAQLWDGEPSEVWGTAERLTRAGFEHHVVLHMLAGAMSGQIWGALHERRTYDRDVHVAALRALPASWGDDAKRQPGRGASRRSERKAQRAARRRNRRRR
jgi:hypothetical protein